MENVLFFFANRPIYSYGAMLGLGLVIGSVLAQREGKRKGFGADFVFRFIVLATLAFIFAGRFACVFKVYGWRTLIYPWTLFGGIQMDERIGLVGAALFTIYFLLRHVQQPARFLDALTPSVALMQSLAHLGSNVLGKETTRTWAVDLGEFSLHPLPLYSALAYYLIFSYLWRMRRNLRYDGQLFLGYLALNALAMRLLMAYREVFGESTRPGLHTLAFVALAAAWLYLFLQSPPKEARRRLDVRNWRSWLFYLASVLGVGLVMIKFFYWRFR